MSKLLPCAAALMLLSLPTWADETSRDLTADALLAGAPAAPDQSSGHFSGDASLGALSTSGNTDTRSVNAKVGLEYHDGAWKHAGHAAAITAQQNDLTTDERYSAGYKLSYDFNPNDYAFGSVDYDNDRFAVRSDTRQVYDLDRNTTIVNWVVAGPSGSGNGATLFQDGVPIGSVRTYAASNGNYAVLGSTDGYFLDIQFTGSDSMRRSMSR